jgi:Pvc16 N-terminal domain
MAIYTDAIADTGATLVFLLGKAMTELVTGEIALYSPGDGTDVSLPKLSLFLYHLGEDPSYVNRDYQKSGQTSLKDPGMALELFYMLVPNSSGATRARDEHAWLGHAMQVLHDNPVLTDPVLQNGLAGKDLTIKITHNPVPLDDLTKIWQALQTRPFKLSVCYRVGPVFIESGNETHVTRIAKAILGQP